MGICRAFARSLSGTDDGLLAESAIGKDWIQK
jgi:hypothetical protein